MMTKKTVFIVWNTDRKEAVVFDDLIDAKWAANIKVSRAYCSSLSDWFREEYAVNSINGELKVEEIEVDEC